METNCLYKLANNILSILLLLKLLKLRLLFSLQLKVINMKNYYLVDQININKFHFEKNILDKKLYIDIFIYYLQYKIIYSKKAYAESKYLTIILGNEQRDRFNKKYEKIGIKLNIKYQRQKINDNQDDYDEKYLKIKIDSDKDGDDLVIFLQKNFQKCVMWHYILKMKINPLFKYFEDNVLCKSVK